MRASTPALFLCAAFLAAPARADSPAEKARKLAQQLATSKDPEMRAVAARSLGILDIPDGVPALLAALKDPAAAVRVNATEALDRLSDHARNAGPALKPLLGDPNLTVRLNAALLLRKLDGATASELATAVAPLLADPDKEVREPALDLLLHLGLEEDAVRQALVGALELGPLPVRKEVALALDRAGLDLRAGVWVLDLVTVLARVAQRDPEPEVRRLAVLTLRSLRPYPREVEDALVRVLEDPDSEVAAAAAAGVTGAAGGLATRAQVQLLKRAKGAPSGAEKVRAALALGRLTGQREALIPLLAPLLGSDPDPAVRTLAARSLGGSDGAAAIVPLLAALKSDSSQSVRAAACTALGSFGLQRLQAAGQAPAVLAALRGAAAELPRDEVVKAAAAALAEIQK